MQHLQPKNTMGVAFVAGVALGYGASLLMPEKAQQKAREEFGHSARKLRDNLMDPAAMAAIKTLMNKGKNDTLDLFFEAKTSLMDEFDFLEESWETVGKKKYEEMVDQVVESMTEARDLTDEMSGSLRRYLRQEYKDWEAKNKKK